MLRISGVFFNRIGRQLPVTEMLILPDGCFRQTLEIAAHGHEGMLAQRLQMAETRSVSAFQTGWHRLCASRPPQSRWVYYRIDKNGHIGLIDIHKPFDKCQGSVVSATLPHRCPRQRVHPCLRTVSHEGT